MALAATCPRRRRGHGDRGHCFSVVLPVTLVFPDGNTVEANDRGEIKAAVRAWKAENPDAADRPTLAFPIDVELEDGTIQTVNSKEELVDLKESCASN